MGLHADVIVTMGCGTRVRVPGKRYLDWDLTDPAGKDVEVVRQSVTTSNGGFEVSSMIFSSLFPRGRKP